MTILSCKIPHLCFLVGNAAYLVTQDGSNVLVCRLNHTIVKVICNTTEQNVLKSGTFCFMFSVILMFSVCKSKHVIFYDGRSLKRITGKVPIHVLCIVCFVIQSALLISV